MATAHVVNLAAQRLRRKNAFLDELLGLALTLDDPEKVMAEPVAKRSLGRMFTMFGVSHLDVEAGNLETVLNTWTRLTTLTVQHMVERNETAGAPFPRPSPTWHPVYVAYVDGLLDGDVKRISFCAQALCITHGIPPGSQWLARGPLMPRN